MDGSRQFRLGIELSDYAEPRKGKNAQRYPYLTTCVISQIGEIVHEQGLFILPHGETVWAHGDRFKLAALYSTDTVEIPDSHIGIHDDGWGWSDVLSEWMHIDCNMIFNNGYLPVMLTKL